MDMHTNVTRRIDNFLQTFLEKASHQTSLTLPHLCSVACVQGARGGGASYACLTLHSLSLFFLFNQTLNNLFLRYSNRPKKNQPYDISQYNKSKYRGRVEGWRLDFPRERGGEEKKRWWGWPKKKSGGSNQR